MVLSYYLYRCWYPYWQSFDFLIIFITVDIHIRKDMIQLPSKKISHLLWVWDINLFDQRTRGGDNSKHRVRAFSPQVKLHKPVCTCESFEVKFAICYPEELEESWCWPAVNDFSQSRLNDLERRATEMNPPMSKLEVTGLSSNLRKQCESFFCKKIPLRERESSVKVFCIKITWEQWALQGWW